MVISASRSLCGIQASSTLSDESPEKRLEPLRPLHSLPSPAGPTFPCHTAVAHTDVPQNTRDRAPQSTDSCTGVYVSPQAWYLQRCAVSRAPDAELRLAAGSD